MSISAPKKVLSVFSLVMINVIAVDSIKNLPVAATFGPSIIFVYLLMGLCFMIPTALITAELATQWPLLGGAYQWVKLAFGPRWGFISMWILWIYNVVWFPTILSFACGTIAYLVAPELINDSRFTVGTVMASFWLCTLVNMKGMKFSSWVSTVGALIGVLIPMFGIIGIGAWLFIEGVPLAIAVTPASFIPSYEGPISLVFLSGIIFSVLGLEMSAVHAGEVKNPKRDYPRALLISSALILVTLMLASFSLAMVVPQHDLDMIAGVIQVFDLFFNKINLPGGATVLAVLIVIGSLASVATWMIGPAKGLLGAAQDGLTPRWLQKTTATGAPINLLIAQGLIGSLLCIAFIVLPSVKSAYWALSTLCSQLALIMYVIIFAAAMRLRVLYPDRSTSFKIPGGEWGIKAVSLLGIFTCLTVIAIGFIPPAEVTSTGQSALLYDIFLGLGITGLLSPAFLIKKKISLD